MIVTIAAIAIFIWALAKQGNIGPLWNNPEEVYGIGRLKGSQLSWTMMRMITSGIGGWAGGILYQSGMSPKALARAYEHNIVSYLRLLPICNHPW